MEDMWQHKDWANFRRARPDITDYVIHRVKRGTDDGPFTRAFDVLVKILECGYLKPTFAVMRPRLYDHSPRPTIKGPYPAVCFTEQTLECFIVSCEHLGSPRYERYGIAIHKWPLFEYGARPVMY